MLRTKLFQAFAALVLIFGLLSGFIGVRIIKNRVINEAQNQVQQNLGSAWSIYDAKLNELETILKLIAGKKAVVDTSLSQQWDSIDIKQRLEAIKKNFGLDFLGLVSPEGQVVLRAAPPFNNGDLKLQDMTVAKALRGESVIGTELMSGVDLEKEAAGLAEQAFLVIEDTPYARPTPKKEDDRGMVLIGAVPIIKGTQLLGAIYGGILLNRNHDLVDRIQNVIFKAGTYKGKPTGTATIFLHDNRIATTVRLANGNRAIGTRVSKEVADRVLDNGLPWVGRAYVVNDQYLTAYDPIRDLDGKVIGMMYVGILERPFQDLGRSIIARFARLTLYGLAASLVLAFFIAGRLARPIHRLVEETNRMHRGEPHTPVPYNASCMEIESLIVAFNEMAGTLEEREARLKEVNTSLRALNQNYMDMLRFVSHELKSPIASVLNYTYLLKEQTLGPLTDKQEKAITSIESNSNRIVEMVRHYLNLSRIETGELKPHLTRVDVLNDVAKPLLENYSGDIESQRMRVDNRIAPDAVLNADLNMVREVFENLISNAIKYGREGGILTLESSKAENMIRFAVRNEGEGVPEDKLDKVFEKFTRLDSGPATAQARGTGLGLFITRTIVEAHGGKIVVESKAGEWIEFRFSLPAA